MTNTIAIMYDFDNTLSTTDMAEYSFIPKLKMDADDFWQESDDLARQHQMDYILSTMYLMMRKSAEKGLPLTRDFLYTCGKNIRFNNGVDTWFDRINSFGKELGLNIKHYIISCGIKPMIEGCSIYGKFSNVFACDFVYGKDGVAVWPSIAMNYSNKLQYLFRINKGIEDIGEHKKLNAHMPEEERPVPFSNMIYVGDGMTDVPIMKITRQNGGHSIGVYFDEEQSKYLVNDDRVDFFVKADYGEDSEMDIAMKAILYEMSARIKLQSLEVKRK